MRPLRVASAATTRLIGLQRCLACGQPQLSAYLLASPSYECGACGALQAFPEGLQLPLAGACPELYAEEAVDDALDTRRARLLARRRDS